MFEILKRFCTNQRRKRREPTLSDNLERHDVKLSL